MSPTDQVSTGDVSLAPCATGASDANGKGADVVPRSLNSREFIDFLDDYLDGKQPAEVRSEFERHLAICPYCVDYLKTYRDTRRLVQSLRGTNGSESTADAPEELIQAILVARNKNA